MRLEREWRPCAADWECPACGLRAWEVTCFGDHEAKYIEIHKTGPSGCPNQLRLIEVAEAK